jgi:YggT family protein
MPLGELILALERLNLALRNGFGAVLLLGAALALLAWLERSRRLNAFGAPARVARKLADPLIDPVERRAVRFGATHVNAPWWALLALLVLGALVVGVLEFVRDILIGAYYATSRGPGGVLRLLVEWTFSLLQLALIVRVVISWIGGTYSRIGRIATGMTEWFLAPLRNVLPRVGMVDIAPLVAYFVLLMLRGFITSAM